MTAKFLIGPIDDGIRTDLKPAFIPEKAFEALLNAYQFRGRIVKRQGFKQVGRLFNGVGYNGTPVMGLKTKEGFNIGVQSTVAFDTTLAYEWNGSVFGPLPSVMPVVWSGTDSDFFFTTNYSGAFWATNNVPGLNGWQVSNFAGSAGAGNLATVNVTSAGNNVQLGDYVYFVHLDDAVAGNAGVLAIVTAIGNPFTVEATNLSSTSTFTWTNGATTTGLVLDSMQTIAGADGIRYYGILSNGTGWANYNPPIDINNALAGALMIFPYRGYLVFLNTWEGNEDNVFNYGNRARWTELGTPYYSAPTPQNPSIFGFDITAVRDDLFGRGGASDAPTSEVIVGAAFIRDILVVFFERSTWRLRFVNNAQNPFVWERVNVELGSQSTFSPIIFDKGVMAIGNRGIIISDGNDTNRIDQKIPDEIFDIKQTDNGFKRVQGIRTFKTRLNYWAFPSNESTLTQFPDQVLVFNYETQTWAIFQDSFTTFGYFYETSSIQTWQELTEAWSATNETWAGDSLAQGFESIIAGNQQGYVLLLEQSDGQNEPSLSISAITGDVITSVNNNLPDETWITLSGVTGTTSSDGVSLNGRNFQLNNPVNSANDFTLSEFAPITAPNASGTSYSTTISYKYLIAGSVQINIGALVFTDPGVDGVLVGSGGSGTINYNTGLINLTFNPAIGSTAVYIRIVSYDPTQGIVPVTLTGVYAGDGEIAYISNIDITTKIFQFFSQDQRARLSSIDFYTDSTTNGQFTCNVLADSSNEIINTPLNDNLISNVVQTSPNPYQIGAGNEAIFRLFADCIAQTLQCQFTYSAQQMAVSSIYSSDIELIALIFNMRVGGRLV